MSKVNFSSVLENRGFKFLWINQALMQLAVNSLNFALILWVFKLTNSNFAVSALIAAYYLPALIFGIFAGVIVDILDRRKVVIIIDLLLGILILTYALVKDYYPLILINAFLINTLNQFFMPTENSSIPMLVPKKHLFLANSYFSLTFYASILLGYTMAGPVFNLFGINTLFIICSMLLFIAFVISWQIPPLKAPENGKKIPGNLLSFTISETKNTIAFVKGKLSVVTVMIILASIQGIIGILAVTVASYMERILKIKSSDASVFLMLPLGFGMVTGALFVGRFLQNAPRRMVIIPAMITGGLLFFIIGIAPALARIFNATDLPEQIPHLRYFFDAPSLSSTFAIGAFLLGVCTVAIIIPSQTVLQEATTLQNRGKIYAALGVLMNLFALIPVLLAGALADIFGVTPIFIGLGVIIFTIGILALRPGVFFTEKSLPYSWREFLGLGHWEKDVS
ncbi:hypothetical protein A3F00_03250 [Candidatus Daviesbacteria bacterium RIFCSPHIGHO2_12_FULL_37_11]|uniref:Major facilitator superfamily (MFS) profile domain-containing protein n=1 Tax=Candidatus Daviesbacteria bacterium RIFCSPHIGHO2_12_FULL_37_11 TaxID=1797777 RepID=A0A1F5KAL2_9BACT|nr:MAG: hypothetical protein A2111_02080 [Candidatus Daviesbacteria bacterium GWA1_38_6]OGE18301.1 MAG: hypothetical protein A2769_03980 [Candidatus Daviesbacteria bacterium RIFCSPHIGHO2_01_FULL_37_27]OGE37834.1 MAG: hypothetical protein A3F00_03250 [Candidatus Daviesbacteria bacterium RIFCSPHIGHO2_12_FULL_37_11]